MGTANKKEVLSMDALAKIERLMVDNNMPASDLAKKADVPIATVNALFARRSEPRIDTIEKLCKVFNLTLSEFFAEEIPDDEAKTMEVRFNKLTEKRKELVKELIDELLK